MNLFEIDALVKTALDGFSVDLETGEAKEITWEEFCKLEGELTQKIENVAIYIKNESAFAEAIKAEKQKLDARQKAIENKVDRLKRYLSDYMIQNNLDKFETATTKLSFRRSEFLDVSEGFNNPAFVKQEIITSIDKRAITLAIKGGEKIEGAGILTRLNLQVK